MNYAVVQLEIKGQVNFWEKKLLRMRKQPLPAMPHYFPSSDSQYYELDFRFIVKVYWATQSQIVKALFKRHNFFFHVLYSLYIFTEFCSPI